MSENNFIREAYAAGLQAALAKKDLLLESETGTVVKDAQDRLGKIAQALESLNIVRSSVPLENISKAFCSGYNDAIVMHRDETADYKQLVSFGELEKRVFCYLLAYIWFNTRQYQNSKPDINTGLLTDTFELAQVPESEQKLKLVKDIQANSPLTLDAGMDKLLSDDTNTCIDDLVTHGRTLSNVDISFSIIPALDTPTEALSVIITPDYEVTDERNTWHFSAIFYPNKGESIKDLAARIAKSLGVAPDEQIWIDANTDLERDASE
jgi:hypothetical protein